METIPVSIDDLAILAPSLVGKKVEVRRVMPGFGESRCDTWNGCVVSGANRINGGLKLIVTPADGKSMVHTYQFEGGQKDGQHFGGPRSDLEVPVVVVEPNRVTIRVLDPRPENERLYDAPTYNRD